jgi:5-formyltetrahydrofolate cyclo-ligase
MKDLQKKILDFRKPAGLLDLVEAILNRCFEVLLSGAQEASSNETLAQKLTSLAEKLRARHQRPHVPIRNDQHLRPRRQLTQSRKRRLPVPKLAALNTGPDALHTTSQQLRNPRLVIHEEKNESFFHL